MVNRRDLLHLSFYKKSPYLGSDGPLRYRIEKAEVEVPADDSGNEDASSGNTSAPADNADAGSKKSATKTVLKVTIWPGPFSYDKTPEEKMSSKNFEFSEEALDEICEWLSEQSSVLSDLSETEKS